jgi:hypothetical protein
MTLLWPFITRLARLQDRGHDSLRGRGDLRL